jgi:hypothetical protein
MIQFCTYNLYCYGPTDTEEERRRRALVHRVLNHVHAAAEHAGDGLVVAVQEIIASEPDGPGEPTKRSLAGRWLAELAEATELRCEYAPGKPAVAVGGQRHHLGWLWNDWVEPVGDLRTIGGPRLWHALGMLAFEVGAKVPVLHANYHAPSVGLHRKADEAEQVRSALLDPRIGLPVLVAADWNFTGADLIVRRSHHADEADSLMFYDHDPHREISQPVRGLGIEWDPEFVHQCIVTVTERGKRRWEVDRRPGHVLYHGGLRDAAAVLNAPWQPTVGHWPGDAMGARRVDAVRVSAHVVDALQAHQVWDQPLPDGTDPATASDHLCVGVTYDPAKIEPVTGEDRN